MERRCLSYSLYKSITKLNTEARRTQSEENQQILEKILSVNIRLYPDTFYTPNIRSYRTST